MECHSFKVQSLRDKICHQIPQNGNIGHIVELDDKIEAISKQFLRKRISHFKPISIALRYFLWKTIGEMDR